MIEEQDLIVKLLTVIFPNAKIYLFGSRARGTHKVTSDIDLAIDAERPLTTLELARAYNIIYALNIPQEIDLVDLNYATDEIKEVIHREGILWN